eukprot:3241772-Pyramimonas_sp.AAC.2
MFEHQNLVESPLYALDRQGFAVAPQGSLRWQSQQVDAALSMTADTRDLCRFIRDLFAIYSLPRLPCPH